MGLRAWVATVHVYLLAAWFVLYEAVCDRCTSFWLAKRVANLERESSFLQTMGLQRVAVVTGADGHIGRHLVALLRRLEFFVCALTKERVDFGDASVQNFAVDLTDAAAVRAVARAIARDHAAVHAVFCNAAVMLHPRALVAGGVETHLAVNVLGHAALVAGLKAPLAAAGDSRVVFLSSVTSRAGAIQSAGNRAIDWSAYGNGYLAYTTSKLVTNVVVERLAADKSNYPRTTFAAVHPGIVLGPLYRHAHPLVQWVNENVLVHICRDAKTAAQRLIVLMTANDLQNGAYYETSLTAPAWQICYVSASLKAAVYDQVTVKSGE